MSFNRFAAKSTVGVVLSRLRDLGYDVVAWQDLTVKYDAETAYPLFFAQESSSGVPPFEAPFGGSSRSENQWTFRSESQWTFHVKTLDGDREDFPSSASIDVLVEACAKQLDLKAAADEEQFDAFKSDDEESDDEEDPREYIDSVGQKRRSRIFDDAVVLLTKKSGSKFIVNEQEPGSSKYVVHRTIEYPHGDSTLLLAELSVGLWLRTSFEDSTMEELDEDATATFVVDECLKIVADIPKPTTKPKPKPKASAKAPKEDPKEDPVWALKQRTDRVFNEVLQRMDAIHGDRVGLRHGDVISYRALDGQSRDLVSISADRIRVRAGRDVDWSWFTMPEDATTDEIVAQCITKINVINEQNPPKQEQQMLNPTTKNESAPSASNTSAPNTPSASSTELASSTSLDRAAIGFNARLAGRLLEEVAGIGIERSGVKLPAPVSLDRGKTLGAMVVATIFRIALDQGSSKVPGLTPARESKMRNFLAYSDVHFGGEIGDEVFELAMMVLAPMLEAFWEKLDKIEFKGEK